MAKMCCRRCIPRRPGSNLDQHQHQDHIKTFSEISYNIYDEVYNQINYGKAEGSCTLGVRAPRTPGQHRPRHSAFCALRARGHVRSARAVTAGSAGDYEDTRRRRRRQHPKLELAHAPAPSRFDRGRMKRQLSRVCFLSHIAATSACWPSIPE
jgi:hypothetical protein